MVQQIDQLDDIIEQQKLNQISLKDIESLKTNLDDLLNNQSQRTLLNDKLERMREGLDSNIISKRCLLS